MILFLYEPDQLAHESVHGSHVAFVNEGLEDLEARLRELAGGNTSDRYITTYYAEATKALSALHASRPLQRLLSHQETGHGVSYARDRRVAKWCRTHNVEWQQMPQSGVARGLCPDGSPETAAATRADSLWYSMWLAHLESFLQADAVDDPFESSPGGALEALSRRLVRPVCRGKLSSSAIGITNQTELSQPGRGDTTGSGLVRGPLEPSFPSVSVLRLPSEQAGDRPHRQKGGEMRALDLLGSFLHERGDRYSGSISSPVSAWTACSRLSPYISWGHISLRTIWQNVEGSRQDKTTGKWKKSLSAFLVRLQWRTSYCQRFEMRCWIEHRNICSAWDHLLQGRTYTFGDMALLGRLSEEERLEAFKQGRTGYPMVDACMRCLLETGWLNFRMRCMLVSFAVYNLWLDWRCIAGHLARCFLDYEPGIHYPQLQMQAGTTGCDLRCYSVSRQAKDQDPKGEFIRQYVVELRELPGEAALEPWKLKASSELGRLAAQYPPRIVDELKTSKASKTVISAYQHWFQAEGGQIGEAPPPLNELLAVNEPKQSVTGKRGRVMQSTDVGTMLRNGLPTKRRKEAVKAGGADEGDWDGAHDGELQEAEGNSAVADNLLFALLRGEHADTVEPSSCGPWSCPRCTLINGVASPLAQSPLICEACGSPRPEDTTKRVNEFKAKLSSASLVIDLD